MTDTYTITKDDVIEHIAKTNMLKRIVSNISKGSESWFDLNDLMQDIYESLLTKQTDEKLIAMYKNNQLNFFLTRIVMNNLVSKTSRYKYNYKNVNGRMISLEKLASNYNEETLNNIIRENSI